MFPTFTLVPDTEKPHKGDLSTSKTPVGLDKRAFEGERWGKMGPFPICRLSFNATQEAFVVTLEDK